MSITVVTKDGKSKKFDDKANKTAGQQLYTWIFKNKPEWLKQLPKRKD